MFRNSESVCAVAAVSEGVRGLLACGTDESPLPLGALGEGAATAAGELVDSRRTGQSWILDWDPPPRR